MPLYEVMRSGSRRVTGTAAPMLEGGDTRFGGVVRLPVGVMLLILAGVLMGLIVAYSVGYTRADAAADRRIEELLLDQRDDLGDEVYAATGRPPDRRSATLGRAESRPAPATDPGPPATSRPETSTSGTSGTGRPADPSPAATEPVPTLEAWQRPRVQWWDDVFLDPINTTPGPWYWVLMQTSREGATRFIEFARERGLETYAVPVNNARSASYRVYVVPGLHTNSAEHEWHAPMRAFIERLGEAWSKEPGSGGRTLDDAYLHYFG